MKNAVKKWGSFCGVLAILLGGLAAFAWFTSRPVSLRAEELTRQVYQDWQDSHFYLHVVMRHSDTDQILRTFQSVLQYLELQELDQYAAANADLAAQIQLLAEMEQASLVNVL